MMGVFFFNSFLANRTIDLFFLCQLSIFSLTKNKLTANVFVRAGLGYWTDKMCHSGQNAFFKFIKESFRTVPVSRKLFLSDQKYFVSNLISGQKFFLKCLNRAWIFF